MPVTYFGQISIGATVPGLSVGFGKVGDALAQLRATASAALSTVQSAAAAIDTQITLLGAAQVAIRIPAAAPLEAQLTASLNLSAGLSANFSNPAGYVAGLLQGIAQIQGNLAVLVPSVALSAQATAAAGVAAGVSAKLGAIDAELAALGNISTALNGQAQALFAVQAALSAALSATLEAAGDYVALSAQLEAEGAFCFLFDGAAANIGAELDLAIASAGINAGTNVRVPIVLVDTANTDVLSGVNAVFRVS